MTEPITTTETEPDSDETDYRTYRATLSWAEIGDRCFDLGEPLNTAAEELRAVADILEDSSLGNNVGPIELDESARAIKAAVRRAFDALLLALGPAGFFESLAWVDHGALSSMPLSPEPTEPKP